MLESCLGIDVLASCLSDPGCAVNIVKSMKNNILNKTSISLQSHINPPVSLLLKCQIYHKIQVAKYTIKYCPDNILRQDFNVLISTSNIDKSSSFLVAQVAKYTSWRRLCDITLDKGVKGTRTLQKLLKELSRPKSCFTCTQYGSQEIAETSCFEDVHSIQISLGIFLVTIFHRLSH